MDNLRNVIDILFRRRCVSEMIQILSSPTSTSCDQWIAMEEFKELWQDKDLQYSGNQLSSMYAVINDNWMISNGYKSVFNVLKVAANEMLTLDADMPVCQYEQYLRWHEMTALVGEDLLSCTYMAEKAAKLGKLCSSFAWKPVLTTNNKKLRHIFNKGLSELHFHLRGSSLNFDINWLSLMNDPSTRKAKDFKNLPSTEPLQKYVCVAALLRLYIFLSINKQIENFPGIKDLMQLWLKDPESFENILLRLNDLRGVVDVAKDSFGHRYGTDIIDYAIPDKLSVIDMKRYYNSVLVGERKLLCDSFYALETHSEPSSLFSPLLYVYIVLKMKFREALIQQNRRIGFENFQQYEINKSAFIRDNTIYKSIIDFAAANCTMRNQNIEYIEYRIAPKKTKEELVKFISQIECNIKKEYLGGDNTNTISFGYVIHFIKKPDDKECYDGSISSESICRNQKLRSSIFLETEAIKQAFLEGKSEIVGVDAANSEFACRPEVFSQSYRKLRDIHHDTSLDFIEESSLQNLGFTYHVGEDFYDIVDGLRAIEEAILFLELQDGDRLGHAIALGINVSRFYDDKHFTTIMPCHNLLDNIAWMLNKSGEMGLSNLTVLYFLQRKYEELCVVIYGEQIPLHTYIQAWLLRGDNPECYRMWESKPHDVLGEYRLCENKQVDVARNNKDARRIFHRYHYDAHVKSEGMKSVEFRIEKQYIVSFVELIESIQRQLQFIIAQKKIAIETNLTSNRRICNIDKYTSHPIVRFYDEGLEYTEPTSHIPPQISVSINTDDQGIFSTSLEKEFTLMTLAMEKWVLPNCTPVVKANSVYRWIDNIRENAFVQRFKN